jgi:hypothetical protein
MVIVSKKQGISGHSSRYGPFASPLTLLTSFRPKRATLSPIRERIALREKINKCEDLPALRPERGQKLANKSASPLIRKCQRTDDCRGRGGPASAPVATLSRSNNHGTMTH